MQGTGEFYCCDLQQKLQQNQWNLGESLRFL